MTREVSDLGRCSSLQPRSASGRGRTQSQALSTQHAPAAGLLFSRLILSYPLRPHELQHVRLPVFTTSRSSLKLMFIESMMPSDHLIVCHPLLLPSIFPSIRVFSDESALHIRWPKHWSFSFCISPSSEYSGLISFRIDWLDLLSVQGTLKSLLQQPQFKSSRGRREIQS